MQTERTKKKAIYTLGELRIGKTKDLGEGVLRGLSVFPGEPYVMFGSDSKERVVISVWTFHLSLPTHVLTHTHSQYITSHKRRVANH